MKQPILDQTPAALMRGEHAEMLQHLEHLRALALRAERMPDFEFTAALNHVLEFLRATLLPHARVEETVVYPVVDELLRADSGTKTMTIDHQAAAVMIGELEDFRHAAASDEVRHRLANLVAGLEAVLRLHFRKEEEVYLPLLDRLSADAAQSLAAALHAERRDNAGAEG
jgi:iron-sulfur cluster repair protein YtfE (RIC family)